ncbi:hypothetical protein HY494_01400 [Candidatus Woesearchaeota archaeon]|nr:hypothetical protein [Candidatus Woesearchaeota archaeon]
MQMCVEVARKYPDIPFAQEHLQMLNERAEALRTLRDNLGSDVERKEALRQYGRSPVYL